MKPNPAARGANEDAELDFGILADSVGFLLRGAAQASGNAFNELTGKPGHFAALTLIASNPGITQMRLAAAIGRSRSTLVPLLDALERDGLASRAASPRDARSHALTITPAGLAWLERMAPRVRDHDKRLTRGLGAAERQALMQMLRALRSNIGDPV